MEQRPQTRNDRTRHSFALAFAVLLATGFASLAGTDTSEQPAETETTEATGTGTFSRIPFRVSVGVRGGYDDNVYTTHEDRHGSGFLNTSLDLQYDFGNPRTKL